VGHSPRRDDRVGELKLVKDSTFKRRQWLIPLVVVAIILIVVFIAYKRLRLSYQLCLWFSVLVEI